MSGAFDPMPPSRSPPSPRRWAGRGPGVGSAGQGSTPLLEIVGWLAAMWAGFLLVLGPQWVRNDLRTDLARLALLRSYPLQGRTVVGAETASSTAVLTVLQLGLVGIAYLAFWGGEVPDPSPELR